MDNARLLERLAGLGRPRVLVVGDLMLDRYVSGDVVRLSPEAPIPVLSARSTEERLGGAGNVAANLRAMDVECEVLGILGDDPHGERLREMFAEIGADATACVSSPNRPTTEKTRLLAGMHQLLRVDWERTAPISLENEERFVAAIEAGVERANAVVLSDYDKGALTPNVLARAIAAGRAHGVPVLVDPKGDDYRGYRGATLVTPNRKEAEEAVGRQLATLEDVSAAARELLETCELDAAVVTLGSEGMYHLERDGHAGRVPTFARAVFDVTGAGDTVISQLALALGDGWSLEEAVHLANHAAGIVVGRRGAAVVSRGELAGAIEAAGGPVGKVLGPATLERVLADWRSAGKRIVFTNGCFDIIHPGHVTYLRQARSRGDVLLVGINDDDSVRRLKGPGRPVNPVEDRAAVLAALEMVDAVVPFAEDTPKEIIERVTPHVLVKGEDWAEKGVVGREWVEAHGGEVFLAPLVPGRSTTNILERARSSPDS